MHLATHFQNKLMSPVEQKFYVTFLNSVCSYKLYLKVAQWKAITFSLLAVFLNVTKNAVARFHLVTVLQSSH